MVYILTLTAAEEEGSRNKFLKERRLTKTFPKRIAQDWKPSAPWIALILSREDGNKNALYLKWMGPVSRTNTPGQLDYSVTIDPLIPCVENISMDGPNGLLMKLPDELRKEFTGTVLGKDVANCGRAFWEAFIRIIQDNYPIMAERIDWLLALGTPPKFNSHDEADRSWQEQQDCAYCISRITGLPPLTFAAWRRPGSRNAPYLAGLIPKPYEQAMAEHDARTVGISSGMFNNWWPQDNTRYDIHVITTGDGRRLEIANVNNTPIEARTGTDMIYYHEPTQSFTLVQYKRLESKTKRMRVDKRFYDQLDRLEEVEHLSKVAGKPSEWRLGGDSCFMKLAYWPENESERATNELANGMYLPVSYIRMLLKDDSTRGTKPDTEARVLGYQNVARHLVGQQFIELVTHGLVGTVGVTVEELRKFVSDRITAGKSVMLGVERSPETDRMREQRLRRRGATDRSYKHEVAEAGPTKAPEQIPGSTTTAIDTDAPTLF